MNGCVRFLLHEILKKDSLSDVFCCMKACKWILVFEETGGLSWL